MDQQLTGVRPHKEGLTGNGPAARLRNPSHDQRAGSQKHTTAPLAEPLQRWTLTEHQICATAMHISGTSVWCSYRASLHLPFVDQIGCECRMAYADHRKPYLVAFLYIFPAPGLLGPIRYSLWLRNFPDIVVSPFFGLASYCIPCIFSHTKRAYLSFPNRCFRLEPLSRALGFG